MFVLEPNLRYSVLSCFHIVVDETGNEEMLFEARQLVIGTWDLNPPAIAFLAFEKYDVLRLVVVDDRDSDFAVVLSVLIGEILFAVVYTLDEIPKSVGKHVCRLPVIVV